MKWWSAATQWRNWPLHWKLGTVLVVPVVGATALGVLRVQGEIERADSYAATKPVVELRAQLLETLVSLQAERKEAVWHGPELVELARATDTQVSRARAVMDGMEEPDEALTQRFRTVTNSLEGLPTIRRQVVDGVDAHIPLNTYNSMIGTVLDFDRTLVGRFPDLRLTNISIALNKIQAAREQASIEQATGLVTLRNNALSETDRKALIEAEGRLDDNLVDLRSAAPDNLRLYYEKLLSGTEIVKRGTMARDARDPGTNKLPYTEKVWNAPFDTTAARMLDVSRRAADQLRSEATTLADDFARRAALAAVLLVLIVLVAAGIGGALARYLVRSVESLRRAALEVAHTRLPETVARIRAGEGADVTVEPVPLHTTEEFGQLARAFDAVHGQAVRSAGEEALLRSNLATILTNLSRRSQGLVERQLRQLEQLEQSEDDPDQLANLFKIDHLATRMRRNNENLMVLSGSGLRRRFNEPVPMPEVLRAAVSEVEHYQRVIIQSAPDARVRGSAVGDLIRSISELIENAANFSPPDSPVVLAAQHGTDGSAQIDVFDEGVGMPDAELYEANQRVAAAGGRMEVPVSRQMGLFVVGRLTARHGIQVQLLRRSDRDGGLCASIYLPAAMVMTEDEPAAQIPNARASLDAQRTWTPPNGALDVTSQVVERLASAGIEIRLSAFPSATTPASILFATTDVQAKPEVEAFSWLERTPTETNLPAMPRPAASPAAATYVTGPNGLPKRVPKSELIGQPREEQPREEQPTARTGDADRNRGFLNGFQAGIRASEDRRRSSEP